MTIQRFKLALNNSHIPLLSADAQRAVFVPQLDSAPRTPRQFVGSDVSIDYNMAQVLYAENAMPSGSGISSVGYRTLIAPTVATDFDSIFALRDAEENTVLFSPAGGKNYVYDTDTSSWVSTPLIDLWTAIYADATIIGDPTASRVTYAYVNGDTFVCYSNLKVTGTVNIDFPVLGPTDITLTLDASLYRWDSTAKALVPVAYNDYVSNLIYPYTLTDVAGTLTQVWDDEAFGINGYATHGTISAISSSSGYLLVASGINIMWGRFNGTSYDFAALQNGEISGSGGAVPEDVQGPIGAILPVAGGFLLFTQRNAIGASYTANNLLTPWVFREVPDAGGLESYEQASIEGTLGSVYAYTSAGMQRISLNSAELIHPEVADFLSRRKIERFRPGTWELYSASVNLDFYTKVTVVGNRYLVISYGTYPGVYSFALVYDFGLQRWGKLRMVHRDCFYYNYGTEVGALTYAALDDVPYDDPTLGTYEGTTSLSNALVAAQHSLAFLKADGSVLIANWSSQVRDTMDDAIVILGRVQLSRSRNTQLNRIELEGFTEGSIAIQPSYDGRNLATATDLEIITRTGDYVLAGCMIDCKNFNLVTQGTFNLSTVIIEAQPSGSY